MMNANSQFATLRYLLIMCTIFILGAGLHCYKSKLVISARYQSN